MKIVLNLCLLFLVSGTAKSAFCQTDEEYKDFASQAMKTFKLTQEESDKFTNALKDARKGFGEIFKEVEKLLEDEKAKGIRKAFPNLTRESLAKIAKDPDDEKIDKILQISKDSKDKFKEWTNSVKDTIPHDKVSKFGKKIDDELRKCITSTKLPSPKRRTPKTDEEKIRNTLDYMGIEDDDTRNKVKELLQKAFKINSEMKKTESSLKKILSKKKISDSEADDAKELVKELKEKRKELEEQEEELLKTVNMKQYLVYIKAREASPKPSFPYPMPGNR